MQAINEPNHEGTCSTKDVGVDTIYAFTKPLEDESATSSYDSNDLDRSSIYDNNYSTTHYDYSVMNDLILSTVIPWYVAQSEVGDDARSRSVELGPIHTNMNDDNHVVTLPGLKTHTQGSLLELNWSV